MKNLQLPRLSDLENIALQMLVSESRMYGLDMVRKSNGSLKRGTIYVTLQRMEEKGLISSEKEEIGAGSSIPRRFYKATREGKLALEAYEYFSQGIKVNTALT